MKKFLMAVAALACMGSVAFAGPNAGGTLIAHDASLAYTVDNANYCGQGVPIPGCECQAADTQLDGSNAESHRVWKVYAAFLPGSSPRLKGMAFGISYTSGISIVAYGNCCGDPNNGAAEFPGAGWPGSDTGTSIVFQNTQTNCIVECYWFAGYNYYGYPEMFCGRAHPDPVLGGNFADDNVPAQQDPIACYGCLGFDTPGQVCCPHEEVPGACCIGQECYILFESQCPPGQWQGPNTDCDPNPCIPPPATGACCIDGACYPGLTEEDCLRAGGTYQGDDSGCDPDPCIPPNPTEETSWGQIKASYR